MSILIPIITCFDLSFAYKDSKKPALKNVISTIDEYSLEVF